MSDTAPPDPSLADLLQHPGLPKYLGKLYRQIADLRKSRNVCFSAENHFWYLTDNTYDGPVRELCREMCRIVQGLNEAELGTAHSSRVRAELRAAILGMRSVGRTCAKLKPEQTAKTHFKIMQQSSHFPPELVRSVHTARMADAKLSHEQRKTIVVATITLLEQLRAADGERCKLLLPITELLKSGVAGNSVEVLLGTAANFSSLVDDQIRVRKAECDAIMQYTAHFTRNELLSDESAASRCGGSAEWAGPHLAMAAQIALGAFWPPI
ncbi:hypothetical protein WJX73_000640 [Symbiochloris irregularis]|uniref:Uncharacterized protein n=1 Tax=Symbiochloris irregularis TaxID=706552 RepID=A0AAW1PW97_9CHLO